ncbi:hypothetical protein R3I93_003161 [Phoxinus phoxinus]|uniref:P2X purinoreceptor 7 intracellular domain-containing protein n=1 Tax=Phoxinus phoxinus TaxID=58324 RepID=A0AAN9DGU7_9TELE
MEADLNASLQSVVEDYSPPQTPPELRLQQEQEEEEDEEQEHTEDLVTGIRPYMFEPLHAESSNGHLDVAAQEQVDTREHLDVSQWCSCGYCQHMDTGLERLCCREVRQVVDKCAEAELQPGCMTQHPGFEAVCLNPWVLQVEYASLVQYYGDYDQDVFTIEE